MLSRVFTDQIYDINNTQPTNVQVFMFSSLKVTPKTNFVIYDF